MIPTKGQRRKNKTKKKRKLRALRRVAKEFGVEGLYFYNRFGWSGPGNETTCSSICDISKYSYMVRAPGKLRNLLEYLTTKKLRGMITRIVHRDDKMEFENLDELKTYLLVKKLAGIK